MYGENLIFSHVHSTVSEMTLSNLDSSKFTLGHNLELIGLQFSD